MHPSTPFSSSRRNETRTKSNPLLFSPAKGTSFPCASSRLRPAVSPICLVQFTCVQYSRSCLDPTVLPNTPSIHPFNEQQSKQVINSTIRTPSTHISKYTQDQLYLISLTHSHTMQHLHSSHNITSNPARFHTYPPHIPEALTSPSPARSAPQIKHRLAPSPSLNFISALCTTRPFRHYADIPVRSANLRVASGLSGCVPC